MANVAHLAVKVSANTAAFRNDLKQAGKSVGGFRGSMASMAGGVSRFASSLGPVAVALAGVAAALKISKEFGELSQAIDKAAKSSRLLGVELADLEGLKFGGSLAGVDESKVIGGLKTMQKRLGEAARGSGAALPALDELGLNAEDLAGQGAVQSLVDIADALSDIEEPAKRAAIASNIFSKGNMEMLLLVGQGGDAIEDMTEDMRENSVITSQSAKEFELWNDRMAVAGEDWGQFWKRVGLGGVRMLNAVAEGTGLAEEATEDLSSAMSDAKAIDAFEEIGEDAEEAAKALEKMAESAKAVGESLLKMMGGKLDNLLDVDPIDAMIKQFESEGLSSDMPMDEFAEMAFQIYDVADALRAAEANAKSMEEATRKASDLDDLTSSLEDKIALNTGLSPMDLQIRKLSERGIDVSEAKNLVKELEQAKQLAADIELGESLSDQFRTPMEEFIKVAEDLDHLLVSGGLVGVAGEAEARRVFAGAQANLADSAGTTPDIFTGRAEAGSAEAIKTILRAQAGSSAVNPQEKLLLEGKKQTAHLGTLLGVVEKGVEKIDPPEVAEVPP